MIHFFNKNSQRAVFLLGLAYKYGIVLFSHIRGKIRNRDLEHQGQIGFWRFNGVDLIGIDNDQFPGT